MKNLFRAPDARSDRLERLLQLSNLPTDLLPYGLGPLKLLACLPMSELHPVGISGMDQTQAEAVHTGFVREGLLEAREKSWEGFRRIKSGLSEGMTEKDGRTLALDIFKEMGSDIYWHQPYVRFGPGTALTFNESLQPDYRLKAGDPVYIDLGPIWKIPEQGLYYEGDVGDSFAFGVNERFESAAATARSLWEQAHKLWKNQPVSGDALYNFLASQARASGYVLVEKVTGHRLSDHPHTQYSKKRLSETSFKPGACLWVLELQINDPLGAFGAFYEDLLF